MVLGMVSVLKYGNFCMYVPNLQVSNFRALKSVHFEGFSNINFIFGQKNCGKTSVLEAMLLGLHGIPLRLFEERSLEPPVRTSDFLHFFYNNERNNNPCINVGDYRVRAAMNAETFAVEYSY